MEAGHHIISLSLGTVAEPSAVVVIAPRTEVDQPESGERRRDWENYFDVTDLLRWPAGHPIPAIVTRVNELMSDKRLAKKCHLLLDITSTGKAPLRVFERTGLYPKSIDLTNAGAKEHSDGVTHVPLRDVIGAAQVIVQTRHLKVSNKLELAPTLIGDLLSFDPKPVARGLDLRGGRNCDLVYALAIGLWWADSLTWGDDPPERHRGLTPGGLHGWMVA